MRSARRPARKRRKDVPLSGAPQDGSDAGEAIYAQMIKPGDEIHLVAGQLVRVLDVAPFDEEDESRSSGCYRSRLRSPTFAWASVLSPESHP